MTSDRAAMPLAGRTAVVSGASRGIGFAIAQMLGGQGARVALLARSDDELRARAQQIGDLALPIVCDVSDPGAVQRVTAQLREEFSGPPDILVNNAGRFALASIEATTLELFRDMLSVNLVAPYQLVHAFVAEMRARGSGHVVTIGSVADRMIFPENGAYAATKFGLRAFHEVLRAELRGSGVRATLVSPGAVDTPLWDEVDPDTRPGFTPRRQMLWPDAVAAAVHYAVTQPASVNIDELRLSAS